jgi:hypothetical protein
VEQELSEAAVQNRLLLPPLVLTQTLVMSSPAQLHRERMKRPHKGKQKRSTVMPSITMNSGSTDQDESSESLEDISRADESKAPSNKRPKEENDSSCSSTTTSNNIGVASVTDDDDDTTDKREAVRLSLSSFPGDVICDITCFLDAHSLLSMRLLNRSFRIQASTGPSGWKGLCQVLWRNKIHVPIAAISHPEPMEGYRLSVLDARSRDYLTRDELMYNPETQQGTIWSFRFKESAGPDWTSWDPWYNGLPCRKMVFLENGAVKTYTPAPTQHQQNHSHQQPGANHDQDVILDDTATTRTPAEGPILSDPPMAMNWRFLTRPLDLPARSTGSYIRFDVGGRDVPTYVVRRSPTQNWGFIMESCWGIFASFELPKRPLGDNSRRIRRRGRRIRRAQDRAGNWFHVEVDDSEASSSSSCDEEEDNEYDGDQTTSSRDSLLVDDSQFTITSGLQWREAFLYNFGARVLPEGEEAVAHFDRTYGSVMHHG